MTNILTNQPTQALSVLGTKIPHIYKYEGVILCDIQGIATILSCSPEEALKTIIKYDRLTVFKKQLYCSSDDFAFLVDELPEASSLAKKIANSIHKSSETALLYFFLFDYQK